jgi:hypothetical protein
MTADDREPRVSKLKNEGRKNETNSTGDNWRFSNPINATR